MSERATIGASELSVGLGWQRVDGDGEPYLSERELWARLTGRLPRYDETLSPDAEVGRWMEPAVLGRFMAEARIGPTDIVPGPQLGEEPFRSVKIPWLHVHPDAMWGREPVELKAPLSLDDAQRWGPSGTDKCPMEYLIQVVAQVAVIASIHPRVSGGWLAALARAPRKRTFAVYRIERDLDLEARVLAAGEAWYQRHVVEDIAPEPDGSSSSSWSLAREWRPVDREVVASLDAEAAVRSIRQVDTAITERAQHRAQLVQQLQVEMGEATVLRGRRGRVLATWRARADGGRTFRLANGRE